ncbi:RusA family crossover junction endodeoxyribonuclease [Comamonadaceae bacterium G21597-S1]|nr:RusA family crossover junction endodeoxyribonuclease [Comamonadaceae bacterium G21597-S1]
MIVIALPYPLSANRYWRPVRIGNHITIVPTKEAKGYRTAAAWCIKSAGIKTPITGRVAIDVKLYPNRPQDWKKRQREHGAAWDDTVMCIDLDNANKVLLDAIKGVAIEDDKWVRRLTCERMEPDAAGARVVITITKIATEQPQESLALEAA